VKIYMYIMFTLCIKTICIKRYKTYRFIQIWQHCLYIKFSAWKFNSSKSIQIIYLCGRSEMLKKSKLKIFSCLINLALAICWKYTQDTFKNPLGTSNLSPPPRPPVTKCHQTYLNNNNSQSSYKETLNYKNVVTL